jgi:oligoendopeptidase F
LPRELALRGLRGRLGGLRRPLLRPSLGGGTKHYGELLQPFGLDARDPAFWQIGLGMIERLIGELEALDAQG